MVTAEVLQLSETGMPTVCRRHRAAHIFWNTMWHSIKNLESLINAVKPTVGTYLWIK